MAVVSGDCWYGDCQVCPENLEPGICVHKCHKPFRLEVKGGES